MLQRRTCSWLDPTHVGVRVITRSLRSSHQPSQRRTERSLVCRMDVARPFRRHYRNCPLEALTAPLLESFPRIRISNTDNRYFEWNRIQEFGIIPLVKIRRGSDNRGLPTFGRKMSDKSKRPVGAGISFRREMIGGHDDRFHTGRKIGATLYYG